MFSGKKSLTGSNETLVALSIKELIFVEVIITLGKPIIKTGLFNGLIIIERSSTLNFCKFTAFLF